MSTSNDNKKGMSSATSATKPESAKGPASSNRKGMEQKDEKKPDASSKPNLRSAKGEKESETKNNKNK